MIRTICAVLASLALFCSQASAGFLLNPHIYAKYPLEFVGYSTITGSGSSYSLPTTGLSGGSGSAAAQGDLLIVWSGWNDGANGDPGVADTTFTWTEVADLYISDTNSTNSSVAWANATTTPPSTIAVNGLNLNAGGAVLLVFRYHNATTPMDATPTTATSANTAIPDPPSITSATTGATIVALGQQAGTNREIDAAPSGYTIKGIADNHSNGWSGGAAILTNQSIGTYNPGTFGTAGSGITSSMTAVTLAIRPN